LHQNLSTQSFLTEFMKVNGMDTIVGKMINDLGEMDNVQINKVSLPLIGMFDIVLCGTHKYHQWLFSKLVKLSNKLKEVNISKVIKEKSLDKIIRSETTKLIRAQIRVGINMMNPNEIVVDKERFQRPSDLLHGGHQDKDPIVPVLSQLDSDLSTLSDLYYELIVHGIMRERECPTSSGQFILSYNEIKRNLENNISIITAKSGNLEQELFSMKNKQQNLLKKENEEIQPLRNNLENQENEKYRLLQEKQRIEAELNEINQNLSKTDMFIEDTKNEILNIEKSFKPKMNNLYDSMHDYQFEIAAMNQEQSVYSTLLSLSNESFNLLDSWSHSINTKDNNQRNDLENNYINHLARYLDKLCDAKMMVINRVNQLKENIESFKRTNETTNKYYAQSFNIDEQLKQYKQHIVIDENTSSQISKDIQSNIDKAYKVIQPMLFDKFIHHIQQGQIGKICDLSKYKQPRKLKKKEISTQTLNTLQMQRNGQQNNPQKKQQLQTNINLSKQQQTTLTSKQQQTRKPPIISNKQQNQQQNQQNNKASKPPRPHYHQQGQPRRPPARNKNPSTMYSHY